MSEKLLTGLIPVERIQGKMLSIRGQTVLLDSDAANFYAVKTGNLNTAVKRNPARFPPDFMFQLNAEEFEMLIKSAQGRGGRRTPPYVFTEQGMAQLATVLKSDVADVVSVQIMRAFVKLRQILASNDFLRSKIQEYDTQFDRVFQILQLMNEMLESPTIKLPHSDKKIGFCPDD